MRQVLAQMRLVFHAMVDAPDFHTHYVELNAAPLMLRKGDRLGAAGSAPIWTRPRPSCAGIWRPQLTDRTPKAAPSKDGAPAARRAADGLGDRVRVRAS